MQQKKGTPATWHLLRFVVYYGLIILAMVAAILCLPRWLAALAVAIVLILQQKKMVLDEGQPIVKKRYHSHDSLDHKPLTAAMLANALPDALLFLDKKAQIDFANQAAFDTFPILALGHKFTNYFRTPELRQMIANGYKHKQAQVLDYIDTSATERAFRVALLPWEDDAYLCIFRERTETRQMEKMRSDFIANASHELRTPLASLRGFIETLQGPALHDSQAREKFLAIMHQQADRMARLIDDLLALAHLEVRTRGDNDQIDLGAVVHHVCDTLEGLAQTLEVTIVRDVARGPLSVYISRDDAIQLLQNLIENACKYGQNGKKVVVSAARKQNRVEVVIRDFGRGIAPEHIPRLTERFYRVNVGESLAQQGTGLGLAIVKHILNCYQGGLAIQSTVGKGTRFTVSLPAS